MDRQPIRGGQQRIVLHTKRKPAFAGIDPYGYYIDRNGKDNLVEVESL